MRPRSFARACVVVAGFALTAAVPLVAARAQLSQQPHPEVTSLTLDGVKHVDKTDLSKSIVTTASQCKNILLEMFCVFTSSPTFEQKVYLDHDELKRDVLRIRVYYWRRGYRDTKVDTTVRSDGHKGVAVTFSVTENAPTIIRKLAIDYDSNLVTSKEISRHSLVRAGKPLDLTLIDSSCVLFRGDMFSRGYSDAVIDSTITVDTASHLADVSLRLVPNHETFVGPITITGLNHVDRKTVLNSITLHTGDPFKKGDDLESQRNLYESNLFRLATIRIPATPDSIKPVTINVAEAPLHDYQAGGGVNTVDFLQSQATYTGYNLLGGARRLDISAAAGNLLANQLAGRGPFYDPAGYVPGADSAAFLAPTWNGSIDFTQPNFLSRPANSVGFGVFAHRRTSPGIFIDKGYGASATFTHNVAVRAPLSLSYRYEVNRVSASDVYFCVDYGVCDTLSINALRAHQALSPVTFSAMVDRSDIPLDPTKGYVARFDADYASAATMSDYRYLRSVFDVAEYTHFGTNVLAAHFEIGGAHALAGSASDPLGGVLHPRARFYAGGANSVRGFGDNQLGPRVLTVAPEKLAGATSSAGGTCDISTIAVRLCDPNTGGLSDATFSPQPLGGTSLVEGSVEWRFPIPLYQDKTVAAIFLDGAVVGRPSVQLAGDDGNPLSTGTTAAITPGFGIRYKASVGPIRFDIGLNPQRAERVVVVTSIEQNGQSHIVPLTITRVYRPGGHTLLDRLTFNFSIGEPY